MGKGHEFQIIIKTKPGAKEWLEEHAIQLEFDARESKFTNEVLTKSNEVGSYGIGSNLISVFNELFKPKIGYSRI